MRGGGEGEKNISARCANNKCFHCEYMKATIMDYTRYEIFVTIRSISSEIKLSVTLADARHISRACSNIIYDNISFNTY